MKTISALLVLLTLVSQSHAVSNYYPKDVQAKFLEESVHDDTLKDLIFKLLSMPHSRQKNGPDKLGCKSGGYCYSQKSIGYKSAKRVLFGKLHLEEDGRGYFVKDVYCNKVYTEYDQNIGPNKIPNHQVVNCEHTWPQSRFNHRFSAGMQKSDLHHLFPTDSKVNGIRGSYEFDDVSKSKRMPNCDASKSQKGNNRFEPPASHKGNVARALFYFSVRYKLPISAKEEKVLKRWHELDPVDHEEEKRNDMIYKVQGNRNPFIDYPSLVDHISNF